MVSGKNFTGTPTTSIKQQQQQQQPKKYISTKLPKLKQASIRQQQQQQSNTIIKPIAQKLPKALSKPLSTPIKEEEIIIKEADISIKEKALRLLNETNGKIGSVTIRFNHYNKSFPIYNTVLKWDDVDDEYSFSFVYKGQYSRDLIYNVVEKSGISLEEYMRNSNNLVLRDDDGMHFIGLVDGEQYYAYIVEGVEGIGAEGLRISSEPLKAVKDVSLKSGNTQVNLITNELKAMNVKDLHSDEARRLKEARDLEDVLFS